MEPRPADVFDMGRGDDLPLEDFNYESHPKRANTTTVPLSKLRYASMTEARARSAAFLKHRNLREYYAFQTALFYVFYCVAA